jgi:Tfp pilus assembly protein PilX
MRINNKERGSALVIVLGMLAVLMLMAVAFSIIMRVERAGTTNLRHSLTAQNGIQSAIAHAIRDIEKSVFHNVVPEYWTNGVMASSGDDVTYDILQPGDPSSDVKVSILTERAQRHLNPTTRALVKNAKVD